MMVHLFCFSSHSKLHLLHLWSYFKSGEKHTFDRIQHRNKWRSLKMSTYYILNGVEFYKIKDIPNGAEFHTIMAANFSYWSFLINMLFLQKQSKPVTTVITFSWYLKDNII